MLAAIVLRGHELSVPAQYRIRSNDAAELTQDFYAERDQSAAPEIGVYLVEFPDTVASQDTVNPQHSSPVPTLPVMQSAAA